MSNVVTIADAVAELKLGHSVGLISVDELEQLVDKIECSNMQGQQLFDYLKKLLTEVEMAR